jgi:hypothetical protein
MDGMVKGSRCDVDEKEGEGRGRTGGDGGVWSIRSGIEWGELLRNPRGSRGGEERQLRTEL